MDIQWIEPAVKERVAQVNAICDEHTSSGHDGLIIIINRLKRVLPKSETKMLSELEELYIQQQSVCVEISYRQGLKDGLVVHRLCNNSNKEEHP